MLTNNHTFDYGEIGFKSTLDECNKYSINTIGVDLSYDKVYEPLAIEIGGITSGFVNAFEAQFGALTTYKNESDILGLIIMKLIMTIKLKEQKFDCIIFCT